ncbi:MAG: D-glycerate dehydrogenase [Deltaproteobacteria bacterium]|nr:D-glycerate dehydrogenase [Deltaproteobacteria bacterium]
MTKPNIYVTRHLPLQILDLFPGSDVEMNREDRGLTKDELLAEIKNRDAVVVVGDIIDEGICRAIKAKCRIIANYGVGYNNIDVKSATQHGIYVSNTPDVVTDATADLTWTLLLATARRVVECDRFVRSGYKGWNLMTLMSTQVSGKTLGIIGGGRIGQAVAERAQGFKMKVIYTDVERLPAFEAATGGKFVDKETLLRSSDFISIHVPLLPSTRHLLGAEEFRLIKKTAFLINAARGPIVDEKALVEALREGQLAGAGLDVFEQEPNLTEGLSELPNVVLTPHVGTQTTEIRIEMAGVCAKNVSAALSGRIPPNCLNPEAKLNQRIL